MVITSMHWEPDRSRFKYHDTFSAVCASLPHGDTRKVQRAWAPSVPLPERPPPPRQGWHSPSTWCSCGNTAWTRFHSARRPRLPSKPCSHPVKHPLLWQGPEWCSHPPRDALGQGLTRSVSEMSQLGTASRSPVISLWPCSQAHMRAVEPSSSCTLTSASQASRALTTSTRPWLTASIRAVCPAWAGQGTGLRTLQGPEAWHPCSETFRGSQVLWQ